MNRKEGGRITKYQVPQEKKEKMVRDKEKILNTKYPLLSPDVAAAPQGVL